MGVPQTTVIVVVPELNEFGRRCLRELAALPEAPEVILVPDAEVELAASPHRGDRLGPWPDNR